MTPNKTCKNCRHKKSYHYNGECWSWESMERCTCKKFEGENHSPQENVCAEELTTSPEDKPDVHPTGDVDTSSSGSDFCLSDKRIELIGFEEDEGRDKYQYDEVDIKEFIRKDDKLIWRYYNGKIGFDQLMIDRLKLVGKELSK